MKLPAEAYHADAETPKNCCWDAVWSQTFSSMVVDLRAFSVYPIFVLHKRMRSPLTATSPGMSPGMPNMLKNNDNGDANHKRHHKATQKPN